MIYADNAATTALCKEAYEAMKPYLLFEYGNASQPYSFSRKNKKALAHARKAIATCINAEPDEIYFTSGGSESDNWALKGSMFGSDDNRTLITSEIEHHAILNTAIAIEKMGYPVVYLPANLQGVISPEILEQSITKDTKLVSIMMANNEIGTIEPIRELAQIAHRNGAIFHTDAVQAVGHINIDVKKLEVDMLSASAHKFNGPKGIGFLYIKKGTPIHAYLDGGSQEFGLRAGTENIAAIVAMAVALQKNCDELTKYTELMIKLETDLIDILTRNNIDFVRNGDVNRLPGNISLSFNGFEGEMLLHRLDLMGICVSTGSACDSKNTQISHVLKAIKLDPQYAMGTVRISFGITNDENDGVAIGEALTKIIKNISA